MIGEFCELNCMPSFDEHSDSHPNFNPLPPFSYFTCIYPLKEMQNTQNN